MRGTTRTNGRQLATPVLVAVVFGLTLPGYASGQSSSLAATANAITLPAGTKVGVTVIRPVPAHTAKPGDALYGQTNYPVAAEQRLAIPAGTWVLGRLISVAPPTRRKDQATLDVLFTKFILANGSVVALPDAPPGSPLPPDATEMRVTIQVSRTNDLLLDNGAQIEMVLAAPVTLDAAQVAQAVPLTRAPLPGTAKSATLCRPTPGTPGSLGTPDTVIPGSPGTPDIVIPGAPGMPDTVIPGTPATPDTVIPGTPGMAGTPGTVCPPQPVVLSSEPVVHAPGTNAPANAARAAPPH